MEDILSECLDLAVASEKVVPLSAAKNFVSSVGVWYIPLQEQVSFLFQIMIDISISNISELSEKATAPMFEKDPHF